MLYKLRVLEETAGKRIPIKGATVRFIGAQGQTLLTQQTDAQGYVFINDETDGDLLFSGVNVSITAKGYYETRFPSETMEPDYWAILQARPNPLKYGLIGAIGAAALLLFTSSSKKE